MNPTLIYLLSPVSMIRQEFQTTEDRQSRERRFTPNGIFEGSWITEKQGGQSIHCRSQFPDLRSMFWTRFPEIQRKRVCDTNSYDFTIKTGRQKLQGITSSPVGTTQPRNTPVDVEYEFTLDRSGNFKIEAGHGIEWKPGMYCDEQGYLYWPTDTTSLLKREFMHLLEESSVDSVAKKAFLLRKIGEGLTPMGEISGIPQFVVGKPLVIFPQSE